MNAISRLSFRCCHLRFGNAPAILADEQRIFKFEFSPACPLQHRQARQGPHFTTNNPTMRPQFPITLISLLISLILSVTAEDAVSRWSNLAAKSSTNVIRLDDTNFDEIITTERNYTVIVALTALAPVYQCALCREFDPAFSTVALSWRKAHPHSDNVFFAKLDFANGRPIFVRVLILTSFFFYNILTLQLLLSLLGYLMMMLIE